MSGKRRSDRGQGAAAGGRSEAELVLDADPTAPPWTEGGRPRRPPWTPHWDETNAPRTRPHAHRPPTERRPRCRSPPQDRLATPTTRAPTEHRGHAPIPNLTLTLMFILGRL